ncbi:hypothetical protein DPMN_187512 [Dreissena polymorpha]|uniref:Uncharacterized protein n=1 Tax=Dreissena polymorpha TaxID=45954 RepID=A0A9D4DP68_DREPO|nr:hypothetical protein DPMN_187512 [Dreissena polymorpha]
MVFEVTDPRRPVNKLIRWCSRLQLPEDRSINYKDSVRGYSSQKTGQYITKMVFEVTAPRRLQRWCSRLQLPEDNKDGVRGYSSQKTGQYITKMVFEVTAPRRLQRWCSR